VFDYSIIVRYLLNINSIIWWKLPCMFACGCGFFSMHGCMLGWSFPCMLHGEVVYLNVERNMLVGDTEDAWIFLEIDIFFNPGILLKIHEGFLVWDHFWKSRRIFKVMNIFQIMIFFNLGTFFKFMMFFECMIIFEKKCSRNFYESSRHCYSQIFSKFTFFLKIQYFI